MKQNGHDIRLSQEEKAIVVSLVTMTQKRSQAMADYSLQELISLAETAGVRVTATLVQHKEYPDTRWFIGKGKVEELKALILEHNASTAIFDQELSGAQVRNLEAELDVKIIDRTQLILDIFAQRAKTREGILQVELAQHSYLLPRLSGQGKNLSRLGGGIGTRGPGETKLETDRRHIRNRIAELKQQLDEVIRHRTLHRERRKKSGVVQAALVGYTNAGKSTLLRQLTNADVYVENQLFATLDPTSRNLELPSGKTIILTDTVGFIQHLPHTLVAAFRATLEEVCEADLILHVVDSSSEMRQEQMRVVDDVLGGLGALGKDRITLFNKIDLCPLSEFELLSAPGTSLKISAYQPDDLDKLKRSIQEKLNSGYVTFQIPAHRGDLISLVYRTGEVIEQDIVDNDMIYKVTINRADFGMYGYALKEFLVDNENHITAYSEWQE